MKISFWYSEMRTIRSISVIYKRKDGNYGLDATRKGSTARKMPSAEMDNQTAIRRVW